MKLLPATLRFRALFGVLSLLGAGSSAADDSFRNIYLQITVCFAGDWNPPPPDEVSVLARFHALGLRQRDWQRTAGRQATFRFLDPRFGGLAEANATCFYYRADGRREICGSATEVMVPAGEDDISIPMSIAISRSDCFLFITEEQPELE